ncbi:MAG: leucine-rich repeat domain-containing protein, partial [Lachnospiraceae bacterium]|nr:leucine-rich repeat domain-containing protein [Lachnospiraceae bacterium]
MPISAGALSDYLNMPGVSKVTLSPKSGDPAVTSNTVNITGTVTIPDGVSVDVEQGVYLNVSGTLNIGAGSTVTNDGVMTNQGTINIGAAGTLINNGTLATSGNITTDTGADVVNNGKMVQTSSATVGSASGTAAITSDCGTCGDSTYYYMDADPDDSTKLRIHVLGIGQTREYTGESDSHAQAWYANDNRKKLKSIVFEDGVTRVGESMFYGDYHYPTNNYNGYKNLTTVILPDSITEIGNYAFYSTSITDINIPDSVEVIGKSAFTCCYDLESITIPDTNIYIMEDAFTQAGLTSIYIPATPTFGGGVFDECRSLATITFADGRTSVGNLTFDGCWELTSVTLPDTLETLPNYMFFNCTKLTSIELPSSLKKIGTSNSGYSNGSVFYQTKIAELVLPEGLEEINKSGLYGMSYLESITIPSSVDYIGEEAFEQDSALTSVRIEDTNGTLTAIRKNTFNYCYNLETVYYGGTDENWDAITIDPTGNGYFLDAKHYFYNYENLITASYAATGGTVKCYIGDDEIGASQAVMGGEEITVVATPASGYETGEITV